MTTSTATLDHWLEKIAALHPREIELGLTRVSAVAERMGVSRPAPAVITVAGTNGKGSCVRVMETLLAGQSISTGAYTSPHIDRFNERVRINGEEASDEDLVAAFARIEQARGDISLSYFEYTTLAALDLFRRAQVDVALLEVGLGGRLDAVNIVDADVAVITSIDFDHQDWLGDSLAAIGQEKAGILRAQRPVVLGSPAMPATVFARIDALACPLYMYEEQYTASVSGDTWQWQGSDGEGNQRCLRGLPPGALELSNIASAIQALLLWNPALDTQRFAADLARVHLPGRWEARVDADTGIAVLLDVAHNPAGCRLAATKLRRYRQARGDNCRCIAVLAVMADKDIEGMCEALESDLHICYIAHFDDPRCMPVSEAVARVSRHAPGLTVRESDSVINAYEAAVKTGTSDDVILVIGSFRTVAAVRPRTVAPNLKSLPNQVALN